MNVDVSHAELFEMVGKCEIRAINTEIYSLYLSVNN